MLAAASPAAAADTPIVASKADAFVAHQPGSDVWSIGSASLEVTIGFDAARVLALQRIANPAAGHTWDIAPGPDASITVGGERITLGNTGNISLTATDARATDSGVILTFTFELRASRVQIARSYACYPGSPTIETWTRITTASADTTLSGLTAWQMTIPLGHVRWLGGLRGDTAGGSSRTRSSWPTAISNRTNAWSSAPRANRRRRSYRSCSSTASATSSSAD